MDISLSSEDITVFQRIYSEKPDTVEWMLKFGSPLEKMIAGLIKKATESKTEVWSSSVGAPEDLECI